MNIFLKYIERIALDSWFTNFYKKNALQKIPLLAKERARVRLKLLKKKFTIHSFTIFCKEAVLKKSPLLAKERARVRLKLPKKKFRIHSFTIFCKEAILKKSPLLDKERARVRLKISFIILSVATLFASCQTLVNDVDPSMLPRSDNRLVVHGYLSPQDTLITIQVSYSSAVVGDVNAVTPTAIKDAVVSLTNQNHTVQIPFNTQNSLYQLSPRQMPILAGQTYQIKVTRQGQTVESSCTIPKMISIQEVKIDSAISPNSAGTSLTVKDYIFRVIWQDPPSESNYYRVAGYMLRTPNTTNAKTVSTPITFSDRRDDVDFFSDYNFQGEQMISGSGKLTMASNNTNDKITYTLMLVHCDKAFYDYHKAVATYDGLNPFTEPSIIPTNIKGGLGCFAGYNKTIFVVKK